MSLKGRLQTLMGCNEPAPAGKTTHATEIVEGKLYYVDETVLSASREIYKIEHAMLGGNHITPTDDVRELCKEAFPHFRDFHPTISLNSQGILGKVSAEGCDKIIFEGYTDQKPNRNGEISLQLKEPEEIKHFVIYVNIEHVFEAE